jgi:type IV fimbrial biogenesis protein FimT
MLDHEKRRFVLTMLRRLYSRGFTLIELMITVALLGVLAVLGMPSYQEWMQNTRIRTTAESIQNGLQLARAEAVKRNARVVFTLAIDSSWTVGCVTPVADNDGDGVADCPAAIQSRSAAEGSSSDIALVLTPDGVNTVTFNSLGQVAPIPAAASFTQVDIDSNALVAEMSRNLRVTLGVGGNTRMCDPNLAATDTRAC